MRCSCSEFRLWNFTFPSALLLVFHSATSGQHTASTFGQILFCIHLDSVSSLLHQFLLFRSLSERIFRNVATVWQQGSLHWFSMFFLKKRSWGGCSVCCVFFLKCILTTDWNLHSEIELQCGSFKNSATGVVSYLSWGISTGRYVLVCRSWVSWRWWVLGDGFCLSGPWANHLEEHHWRVLQPPQSPLGAEEGRSVSNQRVYRSEWSGQKK